ncbi:DsbA family protein [Staphylococcus saprophyticus]|uniref:DsbA family protein n=1 Tax=Staphylococcus saprophyticus TaxID=29385 RepID=UPI000852C837|nr:DsbA family protein [Staphylococcus saprophyticus]MCE5130044.1 DsbA family protein [Staphylococcus saprophyticus]OEK74076.1 protein-disulfide isomerase [Staphylococcus saprophyticus]OEL02870.1 protein-disulfide isomerase [Staphylococcus saprophyticus]WMM14891.1 DsbA family protein [Staphylococcus saprophyticus]
MKKAWLSIVLVLTLVLATACTNPEDTHKDDKTTSDGKIKIIEYGDFKCPYCKKVEKNVMPKLKKHYIDTDKVDYQFVNMAFLGDDSIIGSRAGHAVQRLAPEQYLTFQELMFKKQPNSEKAWITNQIVDQQIDKLKINTTLKKEIKDDYKQENSKSWVAAKKDQKQYKDNHIETAPTVFVHGQKVEDPYDFENYKKILEKE